MFWKEADHAPVVERVGTDETKSIEGFDATHMFATHESYLLMSPDMWEKNKVNVVPVVVDRDAECFAKYHWERILLRWLGGEEVVLKNSILYVRKKGVFLDLKTMSFSHIQSTRSKASLVNTTDVMRETISEKVALLVQVVLLHAALTTSVGYVVGEIIKRMQNLMIHMRLRIFEEQITFKLLAKYISEALIFLPGIVGTLIFVAQFLQEWNLALMLEVLTMLLEFSLAFLMQSKLSRSYIPKFFFLYMFAFLYYTLAYTAGYSWLAFAALVSSVTHLVLLFWNRCEGEVMEVVESRGNSGSFLNSFVQVLQARSWAWIARVDRPLLGDLASVLFFWPPPISTFTIGRISAVSTVGEES